MQHDGCHMWNRIYLPFRCIRDHPKFWLVFQFLCCVLCGVVCLFVFFLSTMTVSVYLSIYECDCPSGIFRSAFIIINNPKHNTNVDKLIHFVIHKRTKGLVNITHNCHSIAWESYILNFSYLYVAALESMVGLIICPWVKSNLSNILHDS